MVHQIKTIKLVELNFNFKENALFERKSKAKNNFCLPLTLIMQKRDHFRHLRHHYSESPVIPLSNDIWYRCVAHGFITFYFLIFYRWSKVEHVRGHLWHIYSVTVKHNQVMVWFGFMVLNVTFKNISVISAMSWMSVLLMEETAVSEENHRPVA